MIPTLENAKVLRDTQGGYGFINPDFRENVLQKPGCNAYQFSF